VTPDERTTATLRGVAVVCAPLLAFALVSATGFFAVSDDDYSRAVIAQRFARAPSWDPSGTSWLPFPFWFTGAAMAVFGRTLVVAKGVALVSSVLAALAVRRSATWLGLSENAAVLAAVAALLLPTAAFLGASMQPEVLTAALVVLAAATTTVDDSRRVLGGAALLLATLSRYEAWPVAGAFAALCLLDARRSAGLALAAALAVAGPALWVLHGALHHGDALFFLHRVAAYRRALGASGNMEEQLFAYPLAALRSEPGLCLAFAVATVAAARRGVATPTLRRPALLVLALLLFLFAGQLVDGAPTHHAERPLLPVFWTMIVFAAVVISRLQFRRGPLLVVSVAAALSLTHVFHADSYAPRTDERAIGTLARKRMPATPLVVDAPDYGYFAVIAAYGTPEDAAPLVTHDPRDHAASPFDSEDSLKAAFDATCPGTKIDGRPCALVVHRDHVELARNLGPAIGERGPFTLIDVSAP
jgi:hypothetical protein